MRLRRKEKRASTDTTLAELLQPPRPAQVDTVGPTVDSAIRDLQSTVDDLQRRVEQLERGQHGHCLGCGDTTGHYSQTRCGREDCEA